MPRSKIAVYYIGYIVCGLLIGLIFKFDLYLWILVFFAGIKDFFEDALASWRKTDTLLLIIFVLIIGSIDSHINGKVKELQTSIDYLEQIINRQNKK